MSRNLHTKSFFTQKLDKRLTQAGLDTEGRGDTGACVGAGEADAASIRGHRGIVAFKKKQRRKGKYVHKLQVHASK